MSANHSTPQRKLIYAWEDDVNGMMAELKRLRAAAERVVWFDWTGNDSDAVAAIDELRRVLQPTGDSQ